ncbi:MAG: HIRAN domain-containing protein [Bacteroidales bacterium]|nr:HIRAN domain-containing protein [Bacteroidales bacterium]
MDKGIIPLTPELMALISGKDISEVLPFKREIFILNDFVAGTSFSERIGEVLDELKPGIMMTLRRHPENEIDNNAIGIYYKDIQIGWVHRRYNTVIARLMDSGKMFTCKIVEKDTSNPEWPRIDVNIYMLDI